MKPWRKFWFRLRERNCSAGPLSILSQAGAFIPEYPRSLSTWRLPLEGGELEALLHALVKASEANGIWTLQAGIFTENAASISLHRSCGFREVGVRRRIGKLGDAWRDVILMERRSATVGK